MRDGFHAALCGVELMKTENRVITLAFGACFTLALVVVTPAYALTEAQKLLLFTKRVIAETWRTAVGPQTFSSGEGGGWSGYTLRVRIEAAQLSNTGGSQVRVTLRGGDLAGAQIGSCYIGMAAATGDNYDFEATPTQLLFSGVGTATIAANTNLLSDAAVFTVAAGKALIVACYFSGSTSLAIQSSATGWTSSYKSANDASTVDATGYTSAINEAKLVKLVETFL
jgi:hypothetical protein